MSGGRVTALLIATRAGGHVVYERFYEALSEAEKGEVRAAFDQAAGSSPSGQLAPGAADDEELVGRHRCVGPRLPGGWGWLAARRRHVQLPARRRRTND